MQYKQYKDYKNITENIFDTECLKTSIKNILSTPRGSLCGKPDYGCSINNYIFDQLDHITINNLKVEISTSLRKYESRIELLDVQIEKDEIYQRILINIEFRYFKNSELLINSLQMEI